MVPDAELSVVGKRVAEEPAVVRGTREGHRLMLRSSIDDGFHLVTETARRWIEIDTTEVIVDGIELMTALRNGACCTEIERTAISRKDRIGLIDGILLEQG